MLGKAPALSVYIVETPKSKSLSMNIYFTSMPYRNALKSAKKSMTAKNSD